MEFDDELINFSTEYITLDESIENSENEIIKILEDMVSNTDYMVDEYRVEYLEDLLDRNEIEYEE